MPDGGFLPVRGGPPGERARLLRRRDDSHATRPGGQLRRKTAAAAAAGSAALAALALALINPGTGDYSDTGLTNPDDAGPAIHALIHGHLSALAHVQPLMGLASLVVRAPFAAVGDALGGTLSTYRFGAFACLWTLAALAVACAIALHGRSRAGAWAAAALMMLNPATTTAVTSGHPEELMLAAAAAAAVWLAARGAATAAAGMTGAAIGVKPFGALALIPALLATGVQRGRITAIALGVGAVLTLPLPLSSPHTYANGSHALARNKRVYAASLWWPLGRNRELAFSTGQGPEFERLRLMPRGLDRGSGVVAAALFAVLAGLVVLLRRREPLAYDALALLAALFFARAFLDSENLEYYAAPAFAALIAWEVLARRRPPLLAAVAVALDVVTFHAGLGRAGLQAAAYLAWVLPLTLYLVAIAARRS